MYVADLERALETFGSRLVQIYGQGETPNTITILSKRDHFEGLVHKDQSKLQSCGTARTGVEVKIIDRQGAPVQAGEIGEVITLSECVMSGYWNNPEATKAALVDGWLHTGDLGVIDATGYLTLKDRSKDMIISGGTNIYPREVEEVLLKHRSVLEVSVVGRPSPEWGEDVVAFVVLRPGEQAEARELEDICLANIARFKRPKEILFVKELPKNNNGKILKTELRAQLAAQTAGGVPCVKS